MQASFLDQPRLYFSGWATSYSSYIHRKVSFPFDGPLPELANKIFCTFKGCTKKSFI